MTTTRIQDKWNSSKVWVIRHYSNGHYTANQEISGKLFYSKFSPITLRHITSIGLLEMEII